MVAIGLIGVAIGLVTRNVEAAVLAVIYPPFALPMCSHRCVRSKDANRIRDFGSNGDPLSTGLARTRSARSGSSLACHLVSLVLTVVLLVGAVLWSRRGHRLVTSLKQTLRLL
jgi:hypothetical protein